ncbi:fatty acid synthase-like [Vespula maculifrons]|uniref:Fatty acid synthase-like n=1 Tax=Vespula maculifrons TaxID=7453 RepID=A0ABD2CT28_VESMC
MRIKLWKSYGVNIKFLVSLDATKRDVCELPLKIETDESPVYVFSSVSCGRRNSEQTNYDMINSIMERIVKKDFPELDIEWGAVGDAGLIADMQN